MGKPIATFYKDPEAILDYTVSWSDWLTSPEIIAGVTWSAVAGITVVSESNTTTAATVWLSGGTAGRSYEVTCHVTTDSTPVPRQDERTIDIKIREQ